MAKDPSVAVLPEHTCWMHLRSVEVGRLAVSVDNNPDIFPINFLVDHGTVVFRTAEGSSSPPRSRRQWLPLRPTATTPRQTLPGVWWSRGKRRR